MKNAWPQWCTATRSPALRARRNATASPMATPRLEDGVYMTGDVSRGRRRGERHMVSNAEFPLRFTRPTRQARPLTKGHAHRGSVGTTVSRSPIPLAMPAYGGSVKQMKTREARYSRPRADRMAPFCRICTHFRRASPLARTKLCHGRRGVCFCR